MYLDDVAVQEQRAELVLKQAQPHQPTHVAEGVHPLGGGATLHSSTLKITIFGNPALLLGKVLFKRGKIFQNKE